MRTFERAVRFEEVDAAGIVFFARYLAYCHDAMEAFFDPLPGGYVGLVAGAGLGFPAVRVECDYKAPLRWGDVAVIETEVEAIGTTSCTFVYTLRRKSDGVTAARARHVTVFTEMATMTKRALSPEVRALLEGHRAAAR